jgi:CRISPR/Cas system endoribonuclease Cas6 (RAMP superfamily)
MTHGVEWQSWRSGGVFYILPHDFLVKEAAFHETLKFNKFLKYFEFKLQKINPRQFDIVINKTHITLFSTNGFGSMTPDI